LPDRRICQSVGGRSKISLFETSRNNETTAVVVVVVALSSRTCRAPGDLERSSTATRGGGPAGCQHGIMRRNELAQSLRRMSRLAMRRGPASVSLSLRSSV
jgi:hypothetical protein